LKAHLLYPDRDFDLGRPLPWNEVALVNDLSLNTLFTAMARGDPFVFEVSKRVVLLGFDNDVETIRYRQNILQDCLNQPAVVRELYAVAVDAMEKQKKHYLGIFARYPDSVLRHSVELMETFLEMLKTLRKITDSYGEKFVAEGWTAFYTMLRRELDDEYFARVEYHLERLKFRGGVLLSAKLGKGNKGDPYVLREPPYRKETFLMRLFGQRSPAYSFTLHPRDESGFRALSELRDRGIGLVANALAQSTGHVRSFFDMLRTELAFYVGCVNLREELDRKGVSMNLPLSVAADERRLSFQGLCDACLALTTDLRVVANDASADRQDLVIVTGANQGGKSTFLRSIGLAQLMMQCGMFVSAESLCSSVRDGLLTHYKREEDTAMKSGKLDEELSRMSDIVDHITPHSMILFNESFAATNEREGSEIARQIISALLDKRVKIVYVTHLHELARGFHERNTGDVLFLRAERQADGTRTFKLLEGQPLQTSFGEDLYNSIFSG
jgi:MutS domain V